MFPILRGGRGICPFFEGSPFCHHEGRRKRWEFLNRCTFRFRSTPSSFFPTQKIGFGAAGPFFSSFELSNKKYIMFPVFFWGNAQNPKKKNNLRGAKGWWGPGPMGPTTTHRGDDKTRGELQTIWGAL